MQSKTPRTPASAGTPSSKAGSAIATPKEKPGSQKQASALPPPSQLLPPEKEGAKEGQQATSPSRMRNVRTFLWRTLYIQAVRRHYWATALELLGVALLFYVSLDNNKGVEKLDKEGHEMSVHERVGAARPGVFVYGPNTSYAKQLAEAVLEELKAHPPEPSREPVLGGVGPGHEQPNTTVIPVTSAEGVVTECLGTFPNLTYFPLLCVALHSPRDVEGVNSASLRYTLYAPTPAIGLEQREFQLGASSFMTDSRTFEKAVKYQYVIDKTHLRIQRSALQAGPDQTNQSDLNITVQELPGWVFSRLNKPYRESLVLAVYVGFLIPFVRRINAIEMEFSSGLAEHQGVLGMTGAQFLVGHFLTIMAYEIWEGATVLCVMYFIANDYDTERAYAAGIDMSLMASGLLLFHLNHALFIILLTWVFPKGWAGLIVGFLVTVAGPDFAGTGPIFLSVANYMTTDRKYKLLSCLLPNTGLVAFLRIIFMARDFEGKADWKVVNQRLLERDNVAISEIWAGMVVTDAAMIVLAWYLSKVLPWSTDNPQGLLFFLMPSYWWSRVDEVPEAAMAQRSSARFEKPPPGVRRIINVQNLTKMFGSKPALNGLDLAVYESKVTVLLGHNGAGKTTLMSILTGIKGPTSGTACVCGFNAAVQRDAIRKVVSLCQQFDIFFGDMTCAENLLYFGSLKGSDMKGLHEAIVDTLKIVNLEEKMHCMPAELSGGMKRRLSMAIAIVSNPKVVILDEPTAGMDPETRRNVWDVIQTVGKKHTVLLSSHDMEEADALGDFIVVMAQGRAVCAGTTAFLKKACGVGYKVALVKANRDFNLEGALAKIRKTAPTAEVEEEKQQEVVIALRTLKSKGFAAMFKALEQSSQKLGIASIGVTVASMKDVYIKINMDWAPGGQEREEAVDDKDIAGVCVEVAKSPTARRRFWALLVKRTIYLMRSWGIITMGLVIPIALQLLITQFAKMPSPSTFRGREENGRASIELKLGAHFPGSTIFLEEASSTSSARLISNAFGGLVKEEHGYVQVIRNTSEELAKMARKDFGLYIRTYPMAVVLEKDL